MGRPSSCGWLVEALAAWPRPGHTGCRCHGHRLPIDRVGSGRRLERELVYFPGGARSVITQAPPPRVKARGWGRVVHSASLQRWRAYDGNAPHGAGMGGVPQLTRAIARKWRLRGITCNAIGLGFFQPALTAAVFDDR